MDLTKVGDVIAQHVDPLLWVVTAQAGPQRGGLIATFVQSVSIVPEDPRILIGIACHHHTWKLIDSSRAFALHLIAEDLLDWVVRFGLCSGWESDKFVGLAATAGACGSPMLEGAPLSLQCTVETSMESGDRTIYLARVVAADERPGKVPLRQKRMLACLSGDQRDLLLRNLIRGRQLDAAAIAKWRTNLNRPQALK